MYSLRLPPPPRIGGTLDGFFDFDLKRGAVGADVPVDRAVVFNDQVSVEIESLAFGGDAVGRQQGGEGARAADDGRATFVPLAAPGERVRARIEREKGKVAWGELTAIERPGPDRVPPPCPLFGTCGGCQWQHVDAGGPARGQAGDRRARASACRCRTSSRRARRSAIGSAPSWRSVRAGRSGFGRGGRTTSSTSRRVRCSAIRLARALPALRGTARAAGARRRDRRAGGQRRRPRQRRPRRFDRRGARAAGDRPAGRPAGVVGLALAGKPTLGRPDVDVAEPGSPPLRVPADGFAQVGRAGNAALVAAAMQAVGPSPGVVLELYAGSGNLTRHLVRVATAVSACDGDPAAIARGARNVPEAAWSLRPPAGEADTVVLDPPREGADRAHLTAASRARRRIVYVSCDPQTLGRDARTLRAAGFELTGAVALDLMPQTFHVEVVATFDRAGATSAK